MPFITESYTYEEACNQMLDRATSYWDTNVGAGVPYVLPNVNSAAILVPHVTIEFGSIESSHQTLGVAPNRRFTRVGQMLFQVFTLGGTRLTLANTIMDGIAKMYEGTNYQNIHVFKVHIEHIGRDGKWWLSHVLVPFEYTEVL